MRDNKKQLETDIIATAKMLAAEIDSECDDTDDADDEMSLLMQLTRDYASQQFEIKYLAQQLVAVTKLCAEQAEVINNMSSVIVQHEKLIKALVTISKSSYEDAGPSVDLPSLAKDEGSDKPN